MEGYRRPPLDAGVFRDADGVVIPYGRRWGGVDSSELPYSVTAHPERFAPVAEVARDLDAALPAAHRPGGAGVPVEIEVTGFPGAIIRVDGRDFPFPACGCDACDEDVERLATEMEELLEAVVERRFESTADGFRYWGEWGSRGGWSNLQGRA